MLERQLKKLGNGIFRQSIKQHASKGKYKNALLGAIDFEWGGGFLLSIQIQIEGHNYIHYLPEGQKLTSIDELRKLILEDMVKAGFTDYKTKTQHLYLASYWSTAELSKVARFWEMSQVINTTNSLMNVTFPGYSTVSPEGKTKTRLTVTILDVYHFFKYAKVKKKGLDSVAKLYGFEGKVTLEGFNGHTELYWKQHMDELLKLYPTKFEEYALQDTILTESLLRKHRDIIYDITGVDILRYPTGGSIAIEFFRTHYMGIGETFSNDNTTVRNFVMLCAHGAVMQAFREGNIGLVYELDFTGFYSQTSANMKLLPRDSTDIITAGGLKHLLTMYDGWACVKFTYPDTWKGKRVYPGLPVQEYYPSLAKVTPILFPKSGISYCTVSEIRGALDFGCKIELLKGYGYFNGTNLWSKMAQEMIDLRAKAKEMHNSLSEGVYKDIPNAGVGKLFQHKGHFSLDLVKAVSKYLNITSGEAVRAISGQGPDCINWELLEEQNEESPDPEIEDMLKYHVETIVRTGAAWMPEWWSIILGRARAAMMWTVNKFASDNLAHISTDSYHDTKLTEGWIDTPFGPYNLGQKGHANMKIVRTKLYIHGDNVAGHAVHTGKEMQRNLIEDGVETTYTTNKRKTIRDAILEDCEFGMEYDKEMQFNPVWDNKMCFDKGSYRPWKNINEFFKHIDTQG